MAITLAERIYVFGGAAFFAVAAFLHLRFPTQIKRLRDNMPPFEFQRRINRVFNEGHYRTIGWLFAFLACSLLMLGVASFFTE